MFVEILHFCLLLICQSGFQHQICYIYARKAFALDFLDCGDFLDPVLFEVPAVVFIEAVLEFEIGDGLFGAERLPFVAEDGAVFGDKFWVDIQGFEGRILG